MTLIFIVDGVRREGACGLVQYITPLKCHDVDSLASSAFGGFAQDTRKSRLIIGQKHYVQSTSLVTNTITVRMRGFSDRRCFAFSDLSDA